MKHGAVALVLLVFLASGCGHSKRTSLHTTREVITALRDAQLVPHRVTLTITTGDTQPASNTIGFSEAVVESDASRLVPLATLDADRSKAMVYIFPTTAAAAGLAGLYPNSVRAQNVVAVPVGAHLSPRMRAAVLRLR